jgi:hypothetical protein
VLAPTILRPEEIGGPSPVPGLLDEHLALRYPGVLTGGQCAAYAAKVLEARESWTGNFEGKQFTLGRAYYTHLEEARLEDYFACAAASDALVRKTLPGLQEFMFAAASALVGAPIAQRPGWCGPGVHVFPARGEVARRGGEVHFDTEGLTRSQLEKRVRTVSLVLMLQRPEIGGGLRLWRSTYEGDDFPRKPDPRVEVTQVAYDVGELVVFDGYRLHQILPFAGGLDRISATVHACFERGGWEAWF